MSHRDDDRGSGWAGIDHVQAAMKDVPLGSIMSHLIDVTPAVRTHKVTAMFDQLLEHAGTTSDELVKRMRSNPRLRRLLWEVGRAAAETELESKIRGLVLVAARGVVDDAEVEPAQPRIRTLAGMDALHVRALRELAAEASGEEAVSLVELLNISDGLAAALGADLLRLAVIQTGAGSYNRVHTMARVSGYGIEILEYLRDAAAGPFDRAEEQS